MVEIYSCVQGESVSYVTLTREKYIGIFYFIINEGVNFLRIKIYTLYIKY